MQSPDIQYGILPAGLVFDNTRADFDKSKGFCPSSSVAAASRQLAKVGELDARHGVGQ